MTADPTPDSAGQAPVPSNPGDGSGSPASTTPAGSSSLPMPTSARDPNLLSRGWPMLGLALVILLSPAYKAPAAHLPVILLWVPALFVFTLTVMHLSMRPAVPGCSGCGVGCMAPIAFSLAGIFAHEVVLQNLTLGTICTVLMTVQLVMIPVLIINRYYPPSTPAAVETINALHRVALWVVLGSNAMLIVGTGSVLLPLEVRTVYFFCVPLCLATGAGIAFASSPECRSVFSLGAGMITCGVGLLFFSLMQVLGGDSAYPHGGATAGATGWAFLVLGGIILFFCGSPHPKAPRPSS